METEIGVMQPQAMEYHQKMKQARMDFILHLPEGLGALPPPHRFGHSETNLEFLASSTVRE